MNNVFGCHSQRNFKGNNVCANGVNLEDEF